MITWQLVRDLPIFIVLADNYLTGLLTPEIIVILFTQGIFYLLCNKMHLAYKDYIANDKIFLQKHKLNVRIFLVDPDTLENITDLHLVFKLM